MSRPRMRMRAAALLAAAAVASSAQGQEAPLRFAVQNEQPPFSYSDVYGELHGFDVEIAWALCAAIDAHCDVAPLDFTDLIPALQGGEIDAAIAQISITEPRRALVDFTDPYFHAENRFVARTDTPADMPLDSLAGKTIGVKRGTTHERYLSDVYGDRVSIRRYSHADEIAIDLALGRLDLAFGNAVSLNESLLRTDLGVEFHFVGAAVGGPKWFGDGEGIAVRKGDAALLARLNAGLRRIVADGTYVEIRSETFGNALAVGEAEAAASVQP